MSVPEDAAVLLADFVSSLDNLPSEVHHILQEISHKESKSNDIRNRALARDQSIQKHAKPTSQGGQGLLVPNPKEEQLVTKIRSDLDRAEAAAKEKVALSERGVGLLSRHLNRLQAQLELLTNEVPPLPTLPSFTPSAQVPMAQAYGGNQMYGASPAGQYAAYGAGQFAPNAAYSNYSGTPGDKRRISAVNSGAGTPSQIPLLPAQQGQSMQGTPNSAYGYGASTPGSIRGLGTPGGNVVRPSRLQNVGSYQGMQPNVAMLQHAQQQQQQQQHQLQQQQLVAAQQQQAQQLGGSPLLSHQQQQQQLRLQQHAVQLAAQQLASQAQAQMQAQHLAAAHHGNKRKRQDRDEEDAMSVSVEGEAEQDGEDMTPYCFCHRPSFGEMIGCDNPTCAIEWFHLACVGLKTTPEGSWFCRDCQDKQQHQQKKHGGAGGNRKGRRG